MGAKRVVCVESRFDHGLQLDGERQYPPIRTLGGAATGLFLPYGVFVDLVHDELVVTNVNSISVFSRTASGNTAPIRTISGSATGLNGSEGLAVDLVNDELFVSDYLTNSVMVFSRTGNGNIAPIRTLKGAATGMSAPYGLIVDTVNNELSVANDTNASITVYSRTASGNAAPIRKIQRAATGLDGPFFLAVNTPTAAAPNLKLKKPLPSAVIQQNNPFIGCPNDPTRGYGYRIKFVWSGFKQPNFDHYHLPVQHVGSPVAAVNQNVTIPTFKIKNCNMSVLDSDLANWYWQVTELDSSGNVLAMSVQSPFSFAACRLSNGQTCAP
jgi:hypothetical protein